ncbi:MAG TPA: purine-nucleoside phosphorylase, partial [Kofleriaceae bacterium]|nr:purine-nucleoside phosphorylase [Kofleriaceae bacterium]
MSRMLFDDLQTAAAAIRERAGHRQPTLGLILGSGLGGFAERLEDAVAIPYEDIPGFPVSTVVGHAGRLVIGSISGLCCAALSGRAHMYEGHSADVVAFPARTLITLGARTLIITNAAGGIRADLRAGDLMLIHDHINLFPQSPLTGANDARLGPRFPDMTHAYAPRLMEVCQAAAGELGIDLKAGVYAGSAGPQYETPAEVKRLAAMGADATGMSTIPEVLVANHMGAEVL